MEDHQTLVFSPCHTKLRIKHQGGGGDEDLYFVSAVIYSSFTFSFRVCHPGTGAPSGPTHSLDRGRTPGALLLQQCECFLQQRFQNNAVFKSPLSTTTQQIGWPDSGI